MSIRDKEEEKSEAEYRDGAHGVRVDGPAGRSSTSESTEPGTPEGDSRTSSRGEVGQIYFIETEDGKYVKIGSCRDCPYGSGGAMGKEKA